jgi:hypothetical protein
MDNFNYVFHEQHTQELFVDEVVEHMLWACKEVIGKLKLADERSKKKHDETIEELVIYEEGDLVLIKSRSSGSLVSKLMGQFKFVKYKDFDRYACILKDDNGKEFDCSVQHLVKVRYSKRLRLK